MPQRRTHVTDVLAALLRFRSCAQSENYRAYIGIDPGLAGALAFAAYRGTRLSHALVLDMPTTKRHVGKSIRSAYDYVELARWFDTALRGYWPNVMIAVEQLQPRGAGSKKKAGKKKGPVHAVSAQTEFSMGGAFFMWHLFFASNSARWHTLPPITWRTKVGMRRATPDELRVRAQQLFPTQVEFLSCKGDADRAVALLLIEATRRIEGVE